MRSEQRNTIWIWSRHMGTRSEVGVGCAAVLVTIAVQLAVYAGIIYGIVRVVKWAWAE